MRRPRIAFLAAAVLMLALAPAVFAAETFTATLSGENQVPPLDVEATGNATVMISDDEQSVSWEVTYSGLTGDPAAGHIHIGAAGENGPVMIPFAEVTATGTSGTFAAADYETGDGLPADWEGVLAAIRSGDTYVNIHTAANPGGEIRGQLTGGVPPTDVETTTTQPGTAPLALLLAVATLGLLVATRRFATRKQ